MSRRNRIQAVVFDFDGVIVDSNHIKADAWRAIFRGSKEVPLELVEEAREKVKASRFDVLRYIFSELGKEKEELEYLVEDYANRYHRVVQAEIFRTGVSSDVLLTLKELEKKYSLYISSATPEDALCDTVAGLGIEHVFEDVLGKPKSKEENLRSILAREHAPAESVVLVGDGEDDKEAASTIGCRFIGVANEFNGWKETQFPIIYEFSELSVLVPYL